jgi:uncharacterized Zn-binding protein involved in type VI secretion
MANPAARMGDMILQDIPHCHANLHPPAPVPCPAPHPGMPLALTAGEFTVLIGKKPAARALMDVSAPCTIPGCAPGGPGHVAIGSKTVLIGKGMAARMGDMTAHPACPAIIPGPTGKVLPPGCPTVLIGG